MSINNQKITSRAKIVTINFHGDHPRYIYTLQVTPNYISQHFNTRVLKKKQINQM